MTRASTTQSHDNIPMQLILFIALKFLKDLYMAALEIITPTLNSELLATNVLRDYTNTVALVARRGYSVELIIRLVIWGYI